jgi:hypothetical protein
MFILFRRRHDTSLHISLRGEGEYCAAHAVRSTDFAEPEIPLRNCGNAVAQGS